jgi:hypothetical protein
MHDANGSQRRLTRLTQLTSPQLLIRLWPVVFRIARLMHRFRQQPPTPARMFQFEVDLQDLLREAGRLIVQWTLNHLEPQEPSLMPPELFHHNDHYRRKRRSPTRNLHCLFGKIRVWRWLYEPTESPLASLLPLELQLGIVASVATPALADCVAQLTVDLSQRQVLDILRAQHQVAWGAETLRKVTARVAEAMSPFQHEAAVAQLQTWLTAAVAEGGPRRIVLSVGRDGLMLPIVGESKYKEGAVATVSVFNRWGRRLGTVYLGQMPQPGQHELSEQLTRLIGDVLSGWEGPLPRLVFVTDAGFHCREYYETTLCRMADPRRPGVLLQWEWVVDYYHACQYVSDLGEALFGPGRAAHAWSAKMRRWLKEKPGGVYRVLRSAGALKSLRGLVGEEDDYNRAYNYLRRHAGSMDYSGCRRRRTPIGSGVTEAACKIVFTQRFKRAGMKWHLEKGGVVLSLRVIALSGLWTRVRSAMLDAQNANDLRTPRKYSETSEKIAP